MVIHSLLLFHFHLGFLQLQSKDIEDQGTSEIFTSLLDRWYNWQDVKSHKEKIMLWSNYYVSGTVLNSLHAWINTPSAQWGLECLSDLAKDPYLIRGEAKVSIHFGLVLKSISFTTNCLNTLHIGILVVTMRREHEIRKEPIMYLVLSYLSRFCLCSLICTLCFR